MMTNKKVNLQALFDEQKSKPPKSYYSNSDYQKEAASKANKGKKLSPKTYVYMIEAAKKRWEENPYIPTEEVCKKRSESMKKYWAERKATMPPKEAEPPKTPKKRGRPKTRPERDPNLPKRGRGRPKTRPERDPNLPKRGRGRPAKVL